MRACVFMYAHNKSNFSAKIRRREKSYEGKNIFEQLSKENSGL